MKKIALLVALIVLTNVSHADAQTVVHSESDDITSHDRGSNCYTRFTKGLLGCAFDTSLIKLQCTLAEIKCLDSCTWVGIRCKHQCRSDAAGCEEAADFYQANCEKRVANEYKRCSGLITGGGSGVK